MWCPSARRHPPMDTILMGYIKMCPSEFYRVVLRSADTSDNTWIIPGLPNYKKYRVVCDEFVWIDASNNVGVYEIETNLQVPNQLDSNKTSVFRIFPAGREGATCVTLSKETHQVIADRPSGDRFQIKIYKNGSVVSSAPADNFVLSLVFQPIKDDDY